MFKSFTEGFKQGYYGKDYVPTPTKPNSFGSFLGRWQATADTSKHIAEKMIQDPQYAGHIKLINWAVTITVLVMIGFTVF